MFVLFILSLALLFVGLFGLVVKKGLISKVLGINTCFAGLTLAMVLLGHKYESGVGMLLAFVVMFITVINGITFLSVALNFFRQKKSVFESDVRVGN